jgi:hypothetical protein
VSEQFSALASFVERTLLDREYRLWSIHVALSSSWPCCLRSENRKVKPPAKAGGQSSEKRLTLAALLAGFLLPALLSALTGLLLLLARLLRAAALLARLALAALLLLARILLVRIVHNRSYLHLPRDRKRFTTSLSPLQITSSRVDVTLKFCIVESVQFEP